MTIDECIEKYYAIAQEIFKGGKSYIRRFIKGEFYDYKVLERVIKMVVKEKLGSEDALMFETANPRCKA